MKRLLKAWLLALISVALIASSALAAIAYSASITVVETGGNTYEMLGCNQTANVDYMAIEYFDGVEGLDTRVLSGATEQKHMLADDRIMFATPLPANSSKTLSFTTGSSNLSSFAIIPGYSNNSSVGYISVSDNANLELSDNFTYQTTGWIDTDAGVDKNLIFKLEAFRVFGGVAATENITAAICTSGNQTETLRPDGHSICLLPDEAGAFCNNHWQNIDEVAPNDADWSGIVLTADNVTDVYTLDNTALPVNATITSVAVVVRGNNGGTNGQYRAGLRIGGDTTWGTAWDDAGWVTHIETLARPGGGDWLRSDLDGLLYCANVYTPAGTDNGHIGWGHILVRYADWDVVGIITGVPSGEETITVTADTAFFYIESASIPWSTYAPLRDDMLFNVPLWHSGLTGSPFTSIDTTGHTCTVTGAVWSSDGRVFNGAEWIVMSDVPFDFERTDPFAIEVWMNTDNTTTFNPVAKQLHAGDYEGYAVEMDGANGRIAFYLINDVAPSQYTRVVGTTAVNDGLWHHIVCQNLALSGGDLSDVQIFIDGNLEAVTASTDTLGANSILNNVNLRIGSRDGGGQPYWGSIGEVRIYDQSLTPAEILANHNATKWKFDGSPEFYQYDSILGGGVPDNSESWTFMENNSMPYADNITMWVGGTKELWFEPIEIITDIDGLTATIHDRTNVYNHGTIHWGGNPSGVVIACGALESDYEAYYTPTTPTQDIAPEVTPPAIESDVAIADAVREAAIANDPFYPAAVAIEEATEGKLPVLLTYWWAYILISVMLFIWVYSKFPNLILAGIAFCLPIGFGISQGLFDFWVIAALIMWMMGCVVFEGRRVIG